MMEEQRKSALTQLHLKLSTGKPSTTLRISDDCLVFMDNAEYIGGDKKSFSAYIRNANLLAFNGKHVRGHKISMGGDCDNYIEYVYNNLPGVSTVVKVAFHAESDIVARVEILR